MADKSRPGYLLTVNWPITGTGGVNEVVLSLARELRLQGYESVIAASESTAAPVRGTEVVKFGIDPPLTARSLFSPMMGFLVRFPLVSVRWLRFLRQREIRIVNAHYPDLNFLFIVVLQRMGLYRGRVVLSFHGADVQEMEQTRGFHRKAWQFLIKAVDGNTTCSEALRKQLLSFVPMANVSAIHNGADIELFRFTARPIRQRRTILQVAKFEPKKGQATLLRATQMLRQTIPDVQVILVGADGPDLAGTRDLVMELGLESCTAIHVNVPHDAVPEFMRSADIFVLPSLVEPFGIALLEAGASGLPVVASRVGGIPELIEDGVSGLLVEAGDVIQLEEALRLLLTDTERADRLAKEWQSRSAQWTWGRTCQQYLRINGPSQPPSQ